MAVSGSYVIRASGPHMRQRGYWERRDDAMARHRDDPYAHLTAGRYLTALRLLQGASPATEESPWTADLLRWALNAVEPWGGA